MDNDTIPSGSPEQLRDQLVDGLLADGIIRSASVEEAFRTVPRDLFAPGVPHEDAYARSIVVVKRNEHGIPISTVSAPEIQATMLEQAETGPWWPQWISRAEHTADRVTRPGPPRPSWCYGTPGIARAQQLAAIALGDTPRQRRAELALSACLTDPAQLRQITHPGLCHGAAGLYQSAWRAARDALTPTIGEQLPNLASLLNRRAAAAAHPTTGLLDGAAGLALARHTSSDPTTSPKSGWDACLLIN